MMARTLTVIWGFPEVEFDFRALIRRATNTPGEDHLSWGSSISTSPHGCTTSRPPITPIRPPTQGSNTIRGSTATTWPAVCERVCFGHHWSIPSTNDAKALETGTSMTKALFTGAIIAEFP
jgi:hypothetical protein